MKSAVPKFAVIFAALAISIAIGAQQVPEAPAGFDGVTNGSAPQNVMDDASKVFQEVEAASPNGLGPVFNDVSCANCHQTQAMGGAAQVLEFRAGHNDSSRPATAVNIKHRGDTNGSAGTFVAATAITANGTAIPNRSLINQRAICPDAQEHVTDVDNIRATRLSLALFGDAFVEAVPDATLLAIAKSNHGEAIMVDVLESPGTQAVGRFGWKTQHASLLSFAGDAYVNEMGVTNPLFPDEATQVCQPAQGVTQPNSSIDDINNFTTFMRALKVPPRGPITAEVIQGQAIFEKIGCATCHVETMATAPAGTAIHGGAYVLPDAIGGKQFHPFGDFLLHDVGTGDGIVQNGPPDTQYKVRTMPLWGLRTRTQFMHDASMGTYSEAVMKHGNEAGNAVSQFRGLSPAQRQLLYQFLGSL
ncbi:MAG: hypothetical protein JWN92_1379 [Candidatus Acidoferrum typicum]|nr:hypothetical protein [Candidatus Acidoferrum typicum]